MMWKQPLLLVDGSVISDTGGSMEDVIDAVLRVDVAGVKIIW
jgi:hypothetical protein